MGAAHEQRMRPPGGIGLHRGLHLRKREHAVGREERFVSLARRDALERRQVALVAVQHAIDPLEQPSLRILDQLVQRCRLHLGMQGTIEVGFAIVSVVQTGLAIEAGEQVVIDRERRVMNDDIGALVLLQIGLV